MNTAPNPFCEYCDLENSGIDPAFCPEVRGRCNSHLENCPVPIIHIATHRTLEDFKINLEEILNRRLQLSTTLKIIAKFFAKLGCFTKQPKFREPISPNR